MGGPQPAGRPEVRAGHLIDVVAAARVVRVAVDVPALADQRRELDYLVPAPIDREVRVGTMVRVPMHGRRVAGWVVAEDVDPPEGVRLQSLARVSGYGPPPDVVALTAWGGWRWAGRRTALLRAASPTGMVRGLPSTIEYRPPPRHADEEIAGMAREALLAREAIVRLPPAADPMPLVAELSVTGPALIVYPTVEDARATRGAVVLPEGWARAAAGGVSVAGARTAVWAPAPDAAVIIVVDAHDRTLGEDRAPAWNAWVAAAERARCAGIPCVLISACPTLEQLRWGQLIRPSRSAERDGWAAVDVIDRTKEDPRSGMLGERLVPILRRATAAGRVVCVLNRKGRIRLLACRACGRLTVCEHCAGPVEQPVKGSNLRCRRCGRERPPVCQACGSASLRSARAGVSKLREELEALLRQPVGEVTSETDGMPDTPVVIGTEAVLRRIRGGVAAVVFLDFDAELLAPRYRAAEEALALLAGAARLVGGRRGGRVVVQTRQPDHPVIAAAVHAEPDRMTVPELEVRQQLGLPPVSAMAELSGDPEIVAEVAAALARIGIDVSGPVRDRWIVRAGDHRILCDALAAVGRPPGVDGVALRIDVDPSNI